MCTPECLPALARHLTRALCTCRQIVTKAAGAGEGKLEVSRSRGQHIKVVRLDEAGRPAADDAVQVDGNSDHSELAIHAARRGPYSAKEDSVSRNRRAGSSWTAGIQFCYMFIDVESKCACASHAALIEMPLRQRRRSGTGAGAACFCHGACRSTTRRPSRISVQRSRYQQGPQRFAAWVLTPHEFATTEVSCRHRGCDATEWRGLQERSRRRPIAVLLADHKGIFAQLWIHPAYRLVDAGASFTHLLGSDVYVAIAG